MPSALRAGVIGWSVAHSLSPRLHNYWLKHYGISGEYVALPVAPEALVQEIKKLAAEGWRGFNLTIPHKEAVLPMLDEIESAAARIGAVNTVVIKDGKLFGSNTDVYGFWENIRPHITGKNKAVIFGAGGGAKAVTEALRAGGFEHLVIANRTIERAQALAIGMDIQVAAWENRAAILENADLLVNTTSLGLEGKDALEIDLSLLPKTALVTDIVYRPLITPLLQQAKDRGNPVVDGLGMLMHQAAPGFEAWFGVKPEVTEALRHHLLEAL